MLKDNQEYDIQKSEFHQNDFNIKKIKMFIELILRNTPLWHVKLKICAIMACFGDNLYGFILKNLNGTSIAGYLV